MSRNGFVHFTSEITVTVDATSAAGLHHVTSDYVETFWLPVIGPSCWCMARHIFRQQQRSEQTWPTWRLGAAVGLYGLSGVNSPINRALNRLLRFRWASLGSEATVDHPAVIKVRQWIPELAYWQVDRLPEDLRHQHAELLEAVAS